MLLYYLRQFINFKLKTDQKLIKPGKIKKKNLSNPDFNGSTGMDF